MKKVLVLSLTFLLIFIVGACGEENERDKPLVMASLFPQYDMARHIGGDYIDVEFLLPPGVSAHTYEPTGRKIIEILNAEMLIYTGDAMEPWVPLLIGQYDQDNLKLLDLSHNIELMRSTQDHSNPSDSHDDSEDPEYSEGEMDDEMDVFEIFKRHDDDAITAYVHGIHWHGTLPAVGVGSAIALSANIISMDGVGRPLAAHGSPNGLSVSLSEGAPSGLVAFETHGDYVKILGLKPGITMVVFHWIYQDSIRFTTPPINIQVKADTSDDNQGLIDPHIWIDPLNAKQMARDIRDALIMLLPEHAEAFTTNAQSYLDELEAVHQGYLNVVEHSELDVIMHGGHNVFGYLTNRYNLDYVNPYRGFSPDAEPTPQALANMIDLMNSKNIDHLFSEVLIDPKVADALYADTGTEILYLYAGENIPADKLAAGFTYIDMLYHNLEQFKIGLKYHEE